MVWRGCHCRVREKRGQIKTECRAVGMSLSMHEMCSMQQICGLTPPCHSTATVTASNTHSVLNIPSAKAELFLETYNVLFWNLCTFHGVKKHLPCGFFALMAFTPFNQTRLNCCCYIPRIVVEVCLYCAIVEPHSYENCLPLACSILADILTEQLPILLIVCREGLANLNSSQMHKDN